MKRGIVGNGRLRFEGKAAISPYAPALRTSAYLFTNSSPKQEFPPKTMQSIKDVLDINSRFHYA